MSRIKDMDAVMAGLLACDPLALLPGEPNPDAASPSPSLPRYLTARLLAGGPASRACPPPFCL